MIPLNSALLRPSLLWGVGCHWRGGPLGLPWLWRIHYSWFCGKWRPIWKVMILLEIHPRFCTELSMGLLEDEGATFNTFGHLWSCFKFMIDIFYKSMEMEKTTLRWQTSRSNAVKTIMRKFLRENVCLNLCDRPCFTGDDMPHMHRRRHPYLPLGLGNQAWLHPLWWNGRSWDSGLMLQICLPGGSDTVMRFVATMATSLYTCSTEKGYMKLEKVLLLIWYGHEFIFVVSISPTGLFLFLFSAFFLLRNASQVFGRDSWNMLIHAGRLTYRLLPGPKRTGSSSKHHFFGNYVIYYLRWVYILWTPTKPAQDEVQPVGILRDVWWSFSDAKLFQIFEDQRQTHLDMVIRQDYHPKHYLWLSIKILQITLDNSWVISTKILQIILANFWK